MMTLPEDLQKFLDVKFQFVESYAEERVNIYSSSDLSLRIVHDLNEKFFMDISIKENPTKNPGDWIILSDLRSYMLNNDDYLKVTEFVQVVDFFRKNYNDIVSLLQTNYEDVIKSLSDRAKHRGDLRFGPIKKE